MPSSKIRLLLLCISHHQVGRKLKLSKNWWTIRPKSSRWFSKCHDDSTGLYDGAWPITWVRKGENHFSLISSKWRFFFLFGTISWAKYYSTMFTFFLFFIQFSLIYSDLQNFAAKLMDTTASRLARHFVRNKAFKMAWSFVLSGYRIWKLKVNKLISDALLKDTQHAWEDQWLITDTYDGVIRKEKSNIRVLLILVCNTLKRCVTPYEKS